MEFVLRHKKLFAILFWIWVVLILYFTLTPNSPNMKIETKEDSFRLDYILHFLVYFSLAILYLLWKANRFLKVQIKSSIYFLAAALLLSGIAEYVQSYIPGRTLNPVDYYSNAAGIILGVLLPRLVLRK